MNYFFPRFLATNTNEEASEKLKKELEEHDVLSSRVGDDTNDNAVDGNDTADAVTPSKQASVNNCLVNDVLSSNPNASGSRRRHHRRHRRGGDPNETATGTGGSTESGSNEEERRRRRATRRAERLRRLNSSPPSTLSNILGT